MDEKRQQLTSLDCEHHILEIVRDDISSQLERYIIAHRQQVITVIENWWDKYHVTLLEIEANRKNTDKQFKQDLEGLRYL